MKKIILLLLLFLVSVSNTVIAHVGASKAHAEEDAYWAELAQGYPAFTPRRHRYLQRSANAKQVGRWGDIIKWPQIPVTAANLPDGRVITWSASQKRSFPRGTEFTHVSTWDPVTNQFVSQNNTYQDMFAAHLSLLEDGRLFVNGGNNHVKTTSVFDYKTNSWSRIDNMNKGRWYPTSVALPSGEVFTALGSSGGRYPEVWNEKTAWKVLTGVDLQTPILQYENYYEREWWPLLHVSPQGYIFHSGPTPQMHNISVKNLGSITQVGTENRDWYPKHGTTILFDEGKLLVAGGAISGSNKKSTNKAMIIDINGISPVVTAVDSMKYPRKFHNGVMLPTGEVMVVGGNTSGIKFSDQGSILPVEIWNPETKKWREAADSSVPRNYHSIALLMPDGRVLSAGGGLCNCMADHEDGQLYSPGYLFNRDGSLASRPKLSSSIKKIKNGQKFTVQSDANIKKFSLIKMSSTTHAINTDLRYLAPKFSALGGGKYILTAHANRNVLTPGYWMLFAVNQDNVPSVAEIIQVSSESAVSIEQPKAQAYLLGSSVSLEIKINRVSDGQFSAENLPQGLAIDRQSGVISGVVSKSGIYSSKIKYRRNDAESEILLTWNIYTRGNIKGVSYESYNGVWNTLPDFSLLSKNNKADYQGATDRFTLASEITSTHFAARLSARLVIDQGDDYQFYLASVDGSRLWIDGKLFIDNDGLHALREQSNSGYLSKGEHVITVEYFVNTGTPNLTLTYSSSSLSKQSISSALLIQNPLTNVAPVISTIESQSSIVGQFVSLNIIANDANGDPIHFTATDLPNGLSINSVTGVISGIPSKIGVYTASISVSDVKGQSNSLSLSWEITGSLEVRKIRKPPKVVNKLINYPVGSNSKLGVQYKWDFGDGSGETAYSKEKYQHRFSKPGSYTVTLTAKDSAGNESSYQFVQAIYLPHAKGKAQSSMSIVYSEASGGNIWNVNPDNNTVTGFNVSTFSKLAEIPVGKQPRSLAFAPNGELWVSNKGSSSISIIDPKSKRVIDTIQLPLASQPYGLVFSKRNNVAYVALEASGQLLKINASSHAIEASLSVGANPRHISLSSTENLLYLSRYITPALPDESTLSPKTEVNGIEYGGNIIVVNTKQFVISNKIILKHNKGIDTEKRARGIPNYLGGIALSPDGKSAWVPSKQDNIKRGMMRDGQNLTFDSAVRSISSKINLVTNKEELSARIDHDNGGIASTAIFGKFGSYLFVALEGSREIEVIDAYNNEPLFRIPTARAPQGLAISDNGLNLYVHNFMDRSVTVFNLFNLIYSQSDDIPLVATLKTVAKESLKPSVFRGKQLFYDSFDARLSKEQYSSCAGCHNEGRGDGRVWDMSGFGEGLRNTISLAGHGGMDQGMLHWSGNFDEIQDFEGQIRGLSAGTGLMSNANFHEQTRQNPLGTKKSGVSKALDDLAAYVSSLKKIPISPYRHQNGTLSQTAKLGKKLFTSKACDECHSGEQFTDSAPHVRHDIGTLKTSSGQRLGKLLDGLDTPTLLGIWQTAPYLHDGSAKTIAEAITAHQDIELSSDEVNQLATYLKQLDQEGDTAPTSLPVGTDKGGTKKSGGGVILLPLFLLIYLFRFVYRRSLRHY